MSPTARALLALELIQGTPGLTGERLAARLGVSDRAARRYVGLLREAGIPVESCTGPYGGYRIGRGARVPPLMFTTAEALGLVMAVLQGWHGSVEADQPAATALGKIVRVLPTSAAAPAEAMRRVRAQNPNDAAASPDPELTGAVAQACQSRSQVRISYHTVRGSDREMVLDPWAVVVRHGRWYLWCWSHTAGARRVLRLDRVTQAALTGQSFDPPVDLDPVRDVEEHLAEGWANEVEVHLEAPAEVARQWAHPTLGRLHPIDERSCLLRGSTEDLQWYAVQLAGMRARFTVLRPQELRDELAAVAARLARAATRTGEVDQGVPARTP